MPRIFGIIPVASCQVEVIQSHGRIYGQAKKESRMPLDRSSCPREAGLTRALGFARPRDFAGVSSRSVSSLVPLAAGRNARAQAVVVRSPNFSFLFHNGSLDSPNFNFVEIDKYWDWRRRTAVDESEVSWPPCPLRLVSVVRHAASLLFSLRGRGDIPFHPLTQQ